MADGRKRRCGAGFSLAVLLAGMLAGSIMLTPVGAHITTFNHLKTKHFYTKKAADARFVNIGEKAASADTATNATNAAMPTSWMASTRLRSRRLPVSSSQSSTLRVRSSTAEV